MIPAGERYSFLKTRNDGIAISLPTIEAQLFHSLTGCRRPEEHAMTLRAADVPGMSQAWAGRMITEWVEQGLLRPESALLRSSYERTARGTEVQAATLEELEETLSESEIPKETVSFLLGKGETDPKGSGGENVTGGDRNIALLLARGDTVILQPPNVSASFKRIHIPEPHELEGISAVLIDLLPPEEECFVDRTTMDEATEELPAFSFEAAVAEYLGKPLSEIQDELILEEASPELLLRLEKTDPTIRALSVGTYGEIPPTDDYAALLSPERLGASHYVRQHLERSLHDGRYFNPRFCAIDLSEAPPPFFPAGLHGQRGQEEITRLLYQVIYPDALCLSLPVAAGHFGFPGQSATGEYGRFALEDWIALATHLALPRLRRNGGMDRLGEVAHWFSELGSLSASACGEYLAKVQGKHRKGLRDRFSRLMEQREGPERWRRRIAGALRKLEEEIEEGPALTDEESERLRGAFANWGALLLWWPTIWETARA